MVLSVRESAKIIADHSEHVKINNDKINEFCQKLFSQSSLPHVDFSHPLHPSCSKDPDFMNWILVIDSLNFCFWSNPSKPTWTVTYEGVRYNGYFALCAAIKKARDNGVNLADAKVSSKLSFEEFKSLLTGDNDMLPNLVEERYKFLLEVSITVLEKYEGTFENVVKSADNSAIKLLELIIEDFPSFRDEGTYLGTKVAFYKRAQILVADLYFCVNSTGDSPSSSEAATQDHHSANLCTFRDINELTMFADYRVPQVLKYFGILEYSEPLMKTLNQDIFIDPDSKFETEIRGNSIEAVERIVRTLNQNNTNFLVNAISVDVFLWNYRRENVKEIDREPYHRVVSVYY